MGDNSDAVKARIAELRREMKAQAGIADRREGAILRAQREKSDAIRAWRLARAEIIELGGRVKQ